MEAALAARHDLGLEYHDAVAASLADRVEEMVCQRSNDLIRGSESDRIVRYEESRGRGQRFILAIISLGAGIPITAISAT